MLIALVSRSLVVGAYLVALLFQGRFDTLAGLVALGVVLVWAAPMARDAVRRRHADTAPTGSVTAAP
jgi:Co/Zn/Cd efflux system component